MKTCLLFALLFACIASVVFADSSASPYSYVAPSEDGRVFALVVAPLVKEPDWHIVLRQPYIALNECQDDGSFKELWRIKDFYSFKVYLSWDAKYLVAIGPWNTGDMPSKQDVALSFFREGKLIKVFSTADLIDDPKKVRVSVSHYEWQDFSDEQYPRVEGNLFQIKTTEGRVVAFGMGDEGVTINKKP